jgi:general secretion pathway protein G
MPRRWITVTLLGVGFAFSVAGLITFGSFYSLPAYNKKEAARIFVTHAMKTPLNSFRIHVGRYPTQEEGLGALFTTPPALAEKWRGPYIEGNRLPLDPWGHPFVYRFPAKYSSAGYDLFSLGPDGVESDDDIGNWQETTSPRTPPGSP